STHCASSRSSALADYDSLISISKKNSGATAESRSVTHVSGLDNMADGGEGGIRTHGTRKGSTVFETARFNHSRTSPNFHSTQSQPRSPDVRHVQQRVVEPVREVRLRDRHRQLHDLILVEV